VVPAFLADLPPAPLVPATPCPGCGAALRPGALLCVACGYSLQAGRKFQTTKKSAPRGDAPAGGALQSAVNHPMFLAGVSAAIYGALIPAAASAGPGSVIIPLFVVWDLMFSLALAILILVLAFRESFVAGLLTLCLPFYVLYFVYGVCEYSPVKWLFAVNIAVHILSFVVFRGPFLQDMGAP
jgi:hypothetical protein